MNYELTNQPLVLLIEQAGVTFGIPLGSNGCQCAIPEVNQTFSETEMDKDFFQRDINVARLAGSEESEEQAASEPAALDDAIAESARSPKRVQGDAGSVEQHSLQDLIAADRFLQSKKAAQNGFGLRLMKISPDGAV